jgi:peptide/nickel transport system substrate-binding protein
MLVLVGALAALVVAAGCSSSSKSSNNASGGQGTSTAVGQPQTGGTLTFETSSEVRSMDPTIAGGSALSGEPTRLLAVYDGLVIVDTTTDTVNMGTAQSVSSTDNVVWTITLKPNIKFSDGSPYDATAVKFNWTRQATVPTAPSAPLMKTVKSMDVVDPSTLKVTLAAPNGVFPRNISASSVNYIASPTAVQAEGKDYGSKPVGAGPFLLKDWTRDSQMTLVRNPSYWKTTLPYLDSVVIKVILDDTQRLNSLTNGEGSATIFQSTTMAKQAKDAGLQVAPIPNFSDIGVAFDLTKAPWDEPDIRKAFIQAIDQTQVNQGAFQGLAELANGWFPPGNPFYDPSLTFPKYDPAAAQRAFDAYATAKGTDVQINIEMTNAGTDAAVNDYLTGVFSKMRHVKYKSNFVAVAQLTTDIRANNFSAITYGFLGVDPEPNMTETFLSNGTRNKWHLNDPALDAALLQARNTSDVNTRKAAYKTAQIRLMEILPMMVWPRARNVTAMNNKVQGLQLFEDGGPRFDLMWMKK